MLINNCVPNRRHLGHVVSVLAAPHQELQGSQEYQESLDPRDHPAIVDLKDPRAQEETQVIKDLVGSKDLKDIQGPRVRRVCQEAKVNRASKDALDPQDHQVNKEIKGQGDKQEARVNQVLVVSKVLREPSEVIGNSVYLRV